MKTNQPIPCSDPAFGDELTELHEDIVSGKTTFEEGQQLA
jgi:hypothetical protein